jgi:hypothetical protein
MNKPKTHDNTTVKDFLANYIHAGDLCEHHPRADDIFTGVLESKTEGISSTRTLSRKVLFQILQWCPVIDVDSINAVTRKQYAYRSMTSYAATARVASKALERFIGSLPSTPQKMTLRQAREELDAPYMAELRELGLV